MTAKVQLKKFSQFVDTLLPHETAYLLNVQQLQDPERLALLQELDIAAKLPNKAIKCHWSMTNASIPI